VTQRPRLVVGMSGSSAPHYGSRCWKRRTRWDPSETHLVLSDGARRTIQLEADLDPELVGRLADVVHRRRRLDQSVRESSAGGGFHPTRRGTDRRQRRITVAEASTGDTREVRGYAAPAPVSGLRGRTEMSDIQGVHAWVAGGQHGARFGILGNLV
jgi:hypothetical protein